MLRSYEPPSVLGTVSGLVPPSFDISRRPAPLCDNRAITSHSGTRPFGSLLSSREDEKLAGERSKFLLAAHCASKESAHRQSECPDRREWSTDRRDQCPRGR